MAPAPPTSPGVTFLSHTCNSVQSSDGQQPRGGQVQIQVQRLLNEDGACIHVHLWEHEGVGLVNE